MEIKINGRTIEIMKGDITEQDTQALVNAANNHLWMGSGVAGALKKKGGESIEKEAIEQGPIQVGQAVITSAGQLPAKYIIHAASMGQDLKTNVDYIAKATLSALEVAAMKEVLSLSFPAIGAGVGGVEVHQCASAMLHQTVEFLQRKSSVDLVRFVLFDDVTYDAFQAELGHMFEKHS